MTVIFYKLGACRLGIKTLVLERSPALGATGTALSIWGNAWRVLDQLGVAESLRKLSVPVTGYADDSPRLPNQFQLVNLQREHLSTRSK